MEKADILDNVYHCIDKFDVCCDSVWIDGFGRVINFPLKKIKEVKKTWQEKK